MFYDIKAQYSLSLYCNKIPIINCCLSLGKRIALLIHVKYETNAHFERMRKTSLPFCGFCVATLRGGGATSRFNFGVEVVCVNKTIYIGNIWNISISLRIYQNSLLRATKPLKETLVNCFCDFCVKLQKNHLLCLYGWLYYFGESSKLPVCSQ